MQETLPPYAAFRKALAAGAKASNDDAAMPAPETSQGRAGPHPHLPYWELRVIPMMALFSLKNVIDSGLDFDKASLQSILENVSLSYHNVMMHVEMLSKLPAPESGAAAASSSPEQQPTNNSTDASLAGPSQPQPNASAGRPKK